MKPYASILTREEQFLPLPLDTVHVGGLLGERIDTTVHNNLLKLDIEGDFLKPFRDHQVDDCYIGLGKLMDAAVHFAQYTRAPEVVAFKERLFSQLIATQEDNGYIGIMRGERRIFMPFDLHDEVHIVSALLEDYRCFGTEASRTSAEKLLSLIMDAYPRMPSTGMLLYGVITKHMMQLGLEHALLNMYDLTHDEKYLSFCLRQCGMDEMDWPIQLERHRPLYGHSYMYLNKSLAHLRLYKLTGNPFHLRQPLRARDFMLNGGGLSVIGGAGVSECWTIDQCGRGNHAETCSTAYQIRFFSQLMQMTGDSRYGDVMERMLYNALLAAQSPDGRRIRYYNPFEGPRRYWPRDTYCCPNNYRRIMAELPGHVVYRDRDGGGLVVNFYTPFEGKTTLNGVPVKIVMETAYPTDDEVIVTLEAASAVEASLRLRIPTWCSQATLQLGNEAPEAVAGGAFAVVARTWPAGKTTLRLRLPMAVRFVRGHACQTGLAAVLRGPVAYTLNPANCGHNPNHATLEHAFRAGEFHFKPDDALGQMESADLKTLRLNTESAVVNADNSLYICADPDGDQIDCLSLLQLKLTPFPDPDGLCTYFHLDDASRAVPDELFE